MLENTGKTEKTTICLKLNDAEECVLKGRPCEFSAFSFIPSSRKNETAERSIYNFKREEKVYGRNYDQLFDINYNFNNKVHRCDRRYGKLYGLKVWDEEIQKSVPTRSSSEYGHRLVFNKETLGRDVNKINENKSTPFNYNPPIEKQDRKHVRIMTVKSEFFNRNGINDLVKSNATLYN